MVQFLPMPAIAYPQNAMINFQPMNQALQFYANNQIERGRFGLQQNADLREQEMHPLRMDRERATTAGLVGAEGRAVRREPYELRHLTAQTGLVGAQTAASRGAERRANDLHGPALGTANLNLSNATLARDQHIASLFAQATTPEQHAMIVSALRSRGIPIPTGLDTWQGSQSGAASIAGPALTQDLTRIAQLNRLDPRRVTADNLAAASAVGWDVNGPRGPTPGQAFALTGQIPQARPMSPQEMQFIEAADNAVVSGNDAIGTLNQALTLSAQAFSGMGAGTRGRIGDTLGMTGGTNTVLLDTLLGRQAVGQLRTLFGGNPTEGERAILMQLEGSSNMSRAARERLISESIQAARQRIAFNTIRAAAMRRGDYFSQAFNPQVNYAAALASMQSGQVGGGANAAPAQQGSAGPAPAPAAAAPSGPAGPRDHGTITRDNMRALSARMQPGDTFVLDGRRWRFNGNGQYSQVQ